MTKQKFIDTTVKLAVLSTPPMTVIKQQMPAKTESKILHWHYEPLHQTFAVPMMLEGAA